MDCLYDTFQVFECVQHGGKRGPRKKYQQPTSLILLGRKNDQIKSTRQHKQINKIQVYSHAFHMTSNLDHGPDYL